jgi:glycosyltransferase involved in cell wall biosynthesis
MNMKRKLTVDFVIPVYYKEAPTLARRIEEQVSFYRKALKNYHWNVVVANNGQRKDVLPVVMNLMKKYKNISYTDIDTPGRGIALRQTWLGSSSDILVYMDADLATNLSSVPDMLSLLSGPADIVTGSRYVPHAKVKRTFSRLFLSRVYNLMLNVILGVGIADSQCGFKGIKRDVAHRVLPYVKDQVWFFDTEMMYVAKKMGYVVREIPVEWYEQDETSVKLIGVSLDYIKNILRLRLGRNPYPRKS